MKSSSEPRQTDPGAKGRFWIAAIASPIITFGLSAAVYGCAEAAHLSTRSALYSWGLFVCVPMACGMIAGLIYRDARTYGQYAGVGATALAVLVGGILLWGFDGLMCVLMSMPLIVPANLIGSGAAMGLKSLWGKRDDRNKLYAQPLLALAALCTRDLTSYHPPVEKTVSTEVMIHASPAKVWRLLHNFTIDAKPDFWLFRHGVAYPVGASTDSPRLGSRRVCRLSTGNMPEIVTAWNPERELAFKVLSTPPCMVETSPYGPIKTPHLTGYFDVEDGRFQLFPVRGGVLLRGTSTYHFQIYPAQYWGLWTDLIVHQVHLRVLSYVRSRAESR